MRELRVPLRYACVDGEVYRGGYPLNEHVPFLKHLKLRTIISITPEPLDQLIDMGDVNYIHISSAGEEAKSKKKRGVPISQQIVEETLKVIHNRENQPVYVHCQNGQQVSSLVVAVLRMRQGWALNSILAEFSRFDDYDRKDIAFIQSCSGS